MRRRTSFARSRASRSSVTADSSCASAYVVGMLVLTVVWVVTEYLRADGWPETLSHNGNPGDWSPWIIWVALAWGFYVLMTAFVIHFRRPTTEAELERELERLRERSAR